MLVVIFRGRIVDISTVILMFYEMHVFSQVCIFDVFLEKYKGEKRSEANPTTSKQWKSLCEMNISGFLCFSKVVRLLKKYEHR